jgi:predicted S18 family serine protease
VIFLEEFSVMNLVSQVLLADSARPVAIWLILIVVSMPALLLLGSPEAMRHPKLAMLEIFGQARSYQQEQERLQREAVESVRFAEEVQVAAERAHESAQRWQELWRQAEEHAGDAWQAWQDAEERLTRARTASVFATPGTPRTAAEYADRERFLHRSLRAAVDSGDLPAEAWRGAWDPRLHPVEQEYVLLKAIREHRQGLYRLAAAAERAAGHDAQLAFAAQDSLLREAAGAEVRADAVRRNLPVSKRQFAPARRAWVQQTA